MWVIQIPWATGLFYALDVKQSGQDLLSATGVHETICGARLRCEMEMLERQYPFSPLQVSGEVAVGRAAAPDRQTAKDHAICEAHERLLGTMWWHGQINAVPAPEEGKCAILRSRKAWRINRSDTLIARALHRDSLPPTMIVVLCDHGFDVCIGLAARPTWAMAGQAAYVEALQLCLGLQIIRQRLQHGLPPDARALRILHRAGGLQKNDLATILGLQGPDQATGRLCKTEQRTEVIENEGIWYSQSTLRVVSALGPRRTGPWSKWRLMI